MLLPVLVVAAAIVGTTPASAKPACTTTGKKWLSYDAHGGAHPKLRATGTTYYISLIGVTCGSAKAALAKMFPRMQRAPYGKTLTLPGGPAGFNCRSQPGNRPDVGFGGQCSSLATHKLFQWAPYDPSA